MIRRKAYLVVVVLAVMSLSSCGLFHKSCNCPHFGNNLKKSSPAATMAA